MRRPLFIGLLILAGCSEAPEWHPVARLDFVRVEGERSVDRTLLDYPAFIEFDQNFSGLQGDGTWSYGHESTIRLWAPADSIRVTLRFSTHPTLAAAGQSIEMLVDGVSAGPPRRIARGWTIDSLSAEVAVPRLEKSAPHTITLRAAVHGNESDSTRVDTPRPIAIYVKTLDIDAAVEPQQWNEWVETAKPNVPGTPRRAPSVRPMTVVKDTDWLVPEIGELPDVLFIVLDAARADHFPVYGYPRDTTPNITALAQDGLVFEQMFSGSSFTLISVATLFTGYSWATHQLSQPADVLPEDYLTMADLLGLAGYWSLAISDNPFVSKTTNLSQGFSDFIQTFSLESGTTGSLTWCFRRRLEEGIPDQRPAFFYLHALPPHSPYTPPPEHDLWKPEGYAGTVDGTVAQLNVIHDQRILPDEADRERWISLYDANLHLADSIAQELIDTYRAQERDRPVWIVVTSDHGEGFGEHGHYEHLGDIHDEMIRIPFILWPAPAWEGRVPDRSAFLSNGDVLPLLLHALGMRDLAASYSNDLRVIRDDGSIVRDRLPLRSHREHHRFGLRSVDYMAIQAGHHEQYFYSVTDDPLQLRNVRRDLDREYTPRIGWLREWVQQARPAATLEPEQADLSESEREALRALGYIE